MATIYPELTIYPQEDGSAIVIERGEDGEAFEWKNNIAVYRMTSEQYSALWAKDSPINEARGSDKSFQEWHEQRMNGISDAGALFVAQQQEPSP